jgi:anthranilate synthase component 1
VADSVPDNEYQETRNKAGAVLKALSLAKHYAAARQNLVMPSTDPLGRKT